MKFSNSRKFSLFITLALIFIQSAFAQVKNEILINHLGYESKLPKQFVISADQNSEFDGFEIVDQHQRVMHKGELKKDGQVDKWENGFYWSGDFSSLTKVGYYRVMIKSGEKKISSVPFLIKDELYFDKIVPEVLTYFELSRCADEFNEKDKKMTFVGKREGTVDVSGGWYDASGDVSKYFSHLSYANYLNPQQAPLAVYHFFFSAELLEQVENKCYGNYVKQFVNEGIYGADFLVRMFDKEGYFYTTVFDVWSHDPEKREICAYETQNGYKKDNYQAAFREGAGFAIAALAKASSLNINGEFTSKDYLNAAEKGFDHLQQHNPSYCDNGKENIIDDYCALIAAVELYKATKDNKYLEAARKRSSLLISRISKDNNYDGWFRADEKGSRPFFHAADAGLPVISLLRYLEIETNIENKNQAINTIKNSLNFELNITSEVTNPFGYARQYVKPVDGNKRGAFFIPHQNESGYWWQGENARLASLTTAALLSKDIVDTEFYSKLTKFAYNQFNWVVGLNPYNMCMIEGLGRNNPKYGEWNVHGGIANGITAGFTDETQIAFMPEPHDKDLAQNWRWPEQWQPHAAWMILALSTAEYVK